MTSEPIETVTPSTRGEQRLRKSPSLNTPIPDPLFILSPPRCFTSIACAMVGQHPQMYGLLETGLFPAATMDEWWETGRPAGLLRCVSELFFGEQTEDSIRAAEGWLRRRSHFAPAYIFELLAAQVAPRMVADKTPAMVSEMSSLERTNEMFPRCRYLYLQRHPRGFGESVMRHTLALASQRNRPVPRWLAHLSADDGAARRPRRKVPAGRLRDPQWDWHRLHRNILVFLERIPRERQMSMRGEDLLAEPDANLRAITEWLGVRSDQEAVDQMKHPERGPYSFIGPPNAKFGTSRYFLENPVLRQGKAAQLSLDGPLAWRADGGEFERPVRRLAESFGYE